jgi:DNA-binding NarL/FixJ family response regulator
MKKVILIVEDEALIREGLMSLLTNEPFVEAIHEAWDKKSFEAAMDDSIDIVLLDFKLKDTNGLDLLRHIRKHQFKAKVISLTGLEGSEVILNLLKADVNGVVYKLDGYGEIRKTILSVMDGESYYSAKVTNIIQKNASKWCSVPPVSLTFKERELLTAMAKGLTTKEIAEGLKMTEATIETYRARLIKKVKVLNTPALIAYAFRNGLL